MANFLTDDEKKKILELYQDGYNTVQTGAIIGRSDCTVGSYLKKCGLKPIGHRKLLNEDDEQKICKLYLSGLTSTEIYEQYYKDKVGCKETIQKVVRSYGIARKGGYKNFINHNYFENIDTPAKAYFLVAESKVTEFLSAHPVGFSDWVAGNLFLLFLRREL